MFTNKCIKHDLIINISCKLKCLQMSLNFYSYMIMHILKSTDDFIRSYTMIKSFVNVSCWGNKNMFWTQMDSFSIEMTAHKGTNDQ